MQLIRGDYNLAHCSAFNRGCVLSIGNFDGVHLGHQQILQRLLAKATELNLPSVVMLFEPHPREFFARHHSQIAPPARLMRLRDKLYYLQQQGIDYVLCIRFNADFCALQPMDFIKNLLVEQLQVKYLSVGDDFRFGANRAGDFILLQQAGQQFGFEVANSHSHCLNNQRISSSLIRQALQQNNLDFAHQLLGRPYSVRGRVAHGNKLGRTIGFPTANINLNRLVTPVQGVYAVRVKTVLGEFNGIANVGNRPTVDGTKPLLEVHIFDFHQLIYGQAIEVFFLKKIRDEIKFTSFDMLKNQIEQDVATVQHFFYQNNNNDNQHQRKL